MFRLIFGCLLFSRLGLLWRQTCLLRWRLRERGTCGSSVILLLICREGIENTAGILLWSIFRVQELFLVFCGDKAQLKETSRHRRESQYGEVVLVGTAVGSTSGGTYMLLHEFSQLHTTLHVGILDELEHNVAFGRVGVEALIVLLIVFLHDDDGVLALSHIEVLRDAFLAATHAAAT